MSPLISRCSVVVHLFPFVFSLKALKKVRPLVFCARFLVRIPHSTGVKWENIKKGRLFADEQYIFGGYLGKSSPCTNPNKNEKQRTTDKNHIFFFRWLHTYPRKSSKIPSKQVSSKFFLFSRYDVCIIRRPLELALGEPGVLGWNGRTCVPGSLGLGYQGSRIWGFWVLRVDSEPGSRGARQPSSLGARQPVRLGARHR